MEAVGYGPVFWKILGTQAWLFLVGLLVAGAYFGGNLYFLLKELPLIVREDGEVALGLPGGGDVYLSRKRLRRLGAIVSGFFALLFATNTGALWEMYFRFTGSTPYGQTDPIYGKDLSLYLLELPFIEAVQGTFVGIVLLGLVLVLAGYFLLGRISFEQARLTIPRGVARHVTANLILLLAAWAWGYYLDRYELLYTPGGVVFGASYVDVHVTIPALWVAFFATLALIALATTNLFKVRPRLLLAGLGLYAVIVLVGLVVAPTAIQQLSVEPNELQLETPYLEHNIRLTQEAYELTDVRERQYSGDQELAQEAIADNDLTIRNIRLWDPRLLIQTYRQIQEIRLYYQFYNVDIDRYMIDGEYRQVMLSARELTQRLPDRADTWVNRHLQYTHGYGITMNFVAQQGNEGIPNLIVKDLPPVSTSDDIRIDQAAIYYGERTPTYRIVNSDVEELHYPQGDDNVYIHYDGDGGVLLSSIWRELLFAWHFSDFNIFLSGYINRESRIQFWNRVEERVRRIAPFLNLDRDPYLVVADGRLYWILDAYTTSRTFPYSEPGRGVNYIRDAVKVVVDPYDGAVDFYVMDPDDPVLKAYRSAFPDLFQPLEDLDPALLDNLRYPKDLFDLQVEKLNRYHMTNPQVFYNNEDLWTRPNETYGGQSQVLEPYYVLTRLPGEEELHFMLMTPLTPDTRDNMISWFAANCDYPDYGTLELFLLPKEKLIYGPNQIEARIDANPLISQQLSLWDQRGSSVIRGNLIIIPIEETFLYVEPVFLIAEGTQIPELRRVIVSFGDRVAMEPSLDGALRAVFGAQAAAAQEAAGDALPSPAAYGVSPDALQEARSAFQQLESAFREGDFTTFGEQLDALRDALNREPPTPSPTDTTATDAAGE
jgi:uncharacterized membrane protein (UPF0182 family)